MAEDGDSSVAIALVCKHPSTSAQLGAEHIQHTLHAALGSGDRSYPGRTFPRPSIPKEVRVGYLRVESNLLALSNNN